MAVLVRTTLAEPDALFGPVSKSAPLKSLAGFGIAKPTAPIYSIMPTAPAAPGLRTSLPTTPTPAPSALGAPPVVASRPIPRVVSLDTWTPPVFTDSPPAALNVAAPVGSSPKVAAAAEAARPKPTRDDLAVAAAEAPAPRSSSSPALSPVLLIAGAAALAFLLTSK